MQPGASARVNTLAIIAFVGVFLMPVVGIVLGVMAGRQIDAGGGVESGRGLARWAVILGIVGTALLALFVIAWFGMLIFMLSQAAVLGGTVPTP